MDKSEVKGRMCNLMFLLFLLVSWDSAELRNPCLSALVLVWVWLWMWTKRSLLVMSLLQR